MKTKYDFEFSVESVKKNIKRLVNQLWKLIPMRENQENWEKHLETVILDISGLNSIFYDEQDFLQLLIKLEGILSEKESVPFSLYRQTIFRAISLLQGLGQKL